jgi:hypothetical protein
LKPVVSLRLFFQVAAENAAIVRAGFSERALQTGGKFAIIFFQAARNRGVRPSEGAFERFEAGGNFVCCCQQERGDPAIGA